MTKDKDYAPQMAPQMGRTFVDRFDAKPLFYPVRKLASGDQDHSVLLTVLESLAPRPAPAPPPAEPVQEVGRAVEAFLER